MKGGGFRTGKAVGLYGELSDTTFGPDDLDSATLPLPPRLLLGLPDHLGDLPDVLTGRPPSARRRRSSL